MGIFRSISMAALRFVLLFALCVGVLSKIDRLEADIEDPADMADEFLNQMSYDKLDKDQDQGQILPASCKVSTMSRRRQKMSLIQTWANRPTLLMCNYARALLSATETRNASIPCMPLSAHWESQ